MGRELEKPNLVNVQASIFLAGMKGQLITPSEFSAKLSRTETAIATWMSGLCEKRKETLILFIFLDFSSVLRLRVINEIWLGWRLFLTCQIKEFIHCFDLVEN